MVSGIAGRRWKDNTKHTKQTKDTKDEGALTMNAMRVFDRARHLSARDWAVTLSCLAPTLIAACAIRVVRVAALLEMAARPQRGTRLTDLELTDRIAAVARIARYAPGVTCLAESLALVWMLRGRGVDAAVRIGVNPGEGLTAHAWVEADGLPVTSPRGTRPLPADRR